MVDIPAGKGIAGLAGVARLRDGLAVLDQDLAQGLVVVHEVDIEGQRLPVGGQGDRGIQLGGGRHARLAVVPTGKEVTGARRRGQVAQRRALLDHDVVDGRAAGRVERDRDQAGPLGVNRGIGLDGLREIERLSAGGIRVPALEGIALTHRVGRGLGRDAAVIDALLGDLTATLGVEAHRVFGHRVLSHDHDVGVAHAETRLSAVGVLDVGGAGVEGPLQEALALDSVVGVDEDVLVLESARDDVALAVLGHAVHDLDAVLLGKNVLEGVDAGLALPHLRVGVDHLVAAIGLIDHKGLAVKLIVGRAGRLARSLHAVPDLRARHALEAGAKRQRDGLRVLVHQVVGARAGRVQALELELLGDLVGVAVDVGKRAGHSKRTRGHRVIDATQVPRDIRRALAAVLELVARRRGQQVLALGGVGHLLCGEVGDQLGELAAVGGGHLTHHGVPAAVANEENVLGRAVQPHAGLAVGVSHKAGRGVLEAVLVKLAGGDGHKVGHAGLHRVAGRAAVKGGPGKANVLVHHVGHIVNIAVVNTVHGHLVGEGRANRKLGDLDADLAHNGLEVDGKRLVACDLLALNNVVLELPAFGQGLVPLAEHPRLAHRASKGALVVRGVPRERGAHLGGLLVLEKDVAGVHVDALDGHGLVGVGLVGLGQLETEHQDDAAVVLDLDALGISREALGVVGMAHRRYAGADLALQRREVKPLGHGGIDGNGVLKGAGAKIAFGNIRARDLDDLGRVDIRIVLGDDVAHAVAVLDGKALGRCRKARVRVVVAVGIHDADVEERDVGLVVGPQGHAVVGHGEDDLAGLVGHELGRGPQALDGPVIGDVAKNGPVVAVDRDRGVILLGLDFGRLRGRRRVQRHVVARALVDQPNDVVDLLGAPLIVVCREERLVGGDLLPLGRGGVLGGVGAGPVLQANERVGGQRHVARLGDAVVVLVVVVLDVRLVGGLLGQVHIGAVARAVGVVLHHDLAAQNREGRLAVREDLHAAAVVASGLVVGDRAVDEEGRGVVDVDAAAARRRGVEAVVVDIDVSQGHGGAAAVDAAAPRLAVGAQNRVVGDDAHAVVVVLIDFGGLVVSNGAGARADEAHAATANLRTVARDLAVVKHRDLCRAAAPHADAAALGGRGDVAVDLRRVVHGHVKVGAGGRDAAAAFGSRVVVDRGARGKRDVADARAGIDTSAVAARCLVAVDVAAVHRDLLPGGTGHVDAAALLGLVVRDLGAAPHREVHVGIGGVIGALIVAKVQAAAVTRGRVVGDLGALVHRDGAVAAHGPAAAVLIFNDAVDTAAIAGGVIAANL